MKIIKLTAYFLGFLLISFAGTSHANHAEHVLVDTKAQISWSANTESDIAGYRLYTGTSSGNYDTGRDMGNVVTFLDEGLTEGVWFYVLTAYDESGNESGVSNEVSKVISKVDTTPPLPPSDLTIAQEIALGAKHLMNALAMLLEPNDSALRIK